MCIPEQIHNDICIEFISNSCIDNLIVKEVYFILILENFVQ